MEQVLQCNALVDGAIFVASFLEAGFRDAQSEHRFRHRPLSGLFGPFLVGGVQSSRAHGKLWTFYAAFLTESVDAVHFSAPFIPGVFDRRRLAKPFLLPQPCT